MNMEELKIVLNNSEDIKRFYVYTKDGKKTEEHLDFDLEDIELIDRLDRIYNKILKNQQWIKNEMTVIDKRQDSKKKNSLMSNNEKLKYEAIKKYYNDQRKAFDMFLGENGVEKLLYGRKFEWGTLNEISEIISNQIYPQLKISMKNITEKVKEKYKNKIENDVLE
jgi:hypothetical protein